MGIKKKIRLKKRKAQPLDEGSAPSRSKSRYRFSPGFAAKAKQRSRDMYRKHRGKKFEFTGHIVLRSLAFLENDAMVLPVRNQDTSIVEHMPIIRLTHAASLLDMSYQSLWRWVERGQLPAPVLVDTTTGRDRGVYHVEEVRIMVHVIGEHLKAFKYYRLDHEGTRDTLFDQITALREANFQLKKGKENHGDQKKGPLARKVRKPRSGG